MVVVVDARLFFCAFHISPGVLENPVEVVIK
jgi:hypothetical protein